jgi:hypothetical protein
VSETFVDFHADLYAPEALRRAVEAYAPVAEIAIEDRGAYRRAILRPRSDAVPRLRDEFANFVLAASVVAGQAERSGAE